jgi:hypothetical protein
MVTLRGSLKLRVLIGFFNGGFFYVKTFRGCLQNVQIECKLQVRFQVRSVKATADTKSPSEFACKSRKKLLV